MLATLDSCFGVMRERRCLFHLMQIEGCGRCGGLMKRLFTFMAFLAEKDLGKSCQTCPPHVFFPRLIVNKACAKMIKDFLPIFTLYNKNKGLETHPIDASEGFK